MGQVRLAVDVGGTFTDLVLFDPARNRTVIEKVLSTPDAPERSVLTGLDALLRSSGVPATEIGRILHATTVVTNALLERKGARTGMITTAGHRDTIEIGRELRYDLYDLEIKFPEPVVAREFRREVRERLHADGSVREPLDTAAVLREARDLVKAGVESIAICFLNSYANPEHEQAAEHAILESGLPVEVSSSAAVAPQIREYERFVTAAINAYVKPATRRYLQRLEDSLAERGIAGRLFVMLSNGGLSTPRLAGQFPVKMLESGPAAGALATEFHSRASVTTHLIGFDMGGTTAKISLIEDQKAQLTQEFEVARVHRFKRGSGYPLTTAAIELVEIGAGGGSIARVSGVGLLKVGPDSAGADPGPACYGRGGDQPTVTDAAVILGYLSPEFFLGGRMRLDRAASEAAITKLGEHLGLDLTATAAGIYDVVNENMASATRMHLAEKGKDPRKFTLFAFGGAGPVHAFEIARRLGIKRLVCARGAGITAACGALMAAPAMDFVRSCHGRLEALDWSRVAGLFTEMEQQGVETMREAGIAPGAARIERSVDLRYALQGYTLQVKLPDGALASALGSALADAFALAHEAQYGRAYSDVPIEAVNWRVWIHSAPELIDLWGGTDPTGAGVRAAKGRRSIFLPGLKQFREVPVYDREALAVGAWQDGPAIVEERESTAVIGPDARFTIDVQQNLIVELA